MRSILMVGNSLTSANNMPQMLASILGAEVVAITRAAERGWRSFRMRKPGQVSVHGKRFHLETLTWS